MSEEGDIVARFVERIAEYKTTVRRVSADDVASVAADQCRLRDVARLGIPSDLPIEWQPDGPHSSSVRSTLVLSTRSTEQ